MPRPNSHHFIVQGQTAAVANSLGQPWQGDYVFNSGDLVLDLLPNFFLEVGARTHKIRVYEMTDHPIARQMLGYLLVRGGVHALAYAKALEELTGATVSRMLNIPNIPNSAFPETKQWEDQGSHRTLYRFSETDFTNLATVWKGVHPDDGEEVGVEQGPPAGGEQADLPESPEHFAPGYDPGGWRRSLEVDGRKVSICAGRRASIEPAHPTCGLAVPLVIGRASRPRRGVVGRPLSLRLASAAGSPFLRRPATAHATGTPDGRGERPLRSQLRVH